MLQYVDNISQNVIVFVILCVNVSGVCPGNTKLLFLGNETMDCASGTTFNVTVCTCVRSIPCGY